MKPKDILEASARSLKLSAIELEIADEMERQIAKFGVQNHEPPIYLTILMEEVGEAAQAALHAKNDFRPGSGWNEAKLKEYRKELIQVAAVAMSMIECLDRGEWKA